MDLDKIIHGLKAHFYASDPVFTGAVLMIGVYIGNASTDVGAAVVKLPLFVFIILAALMIGLYISDHVSQGEAIPSTETESDTLSDEPQLQLTKIEPSPHRGFLGQSWLASTPDQPITTGTPQAPEARHRSYSKAFSQN